MKTKTHGSAAFLLSFFTLIVLSVDCFAGSIVPIPTKAIIATDLIGRKLSEGTDNGYFPSDWSWAIEAGQISDLYILSRSVSEDYCSFVVFMTLQRYLCPTKYNATVQVDYSLLNNKWTPILVKSKGIRVVDSGKYSDCISLKLEESYGGWTNYLKIKNNIDSPLLVGGLIRINDSSEWEKFSVTINGLEESMVGMGCGNVRGSVVNYRIHFVELY